MKDKTNKSKELKSHCVKHYLKICPECAVSGVWDFEIQKKDTSWEEDFKEDISKLIGDLWELLPDVKYKNVSKSGVLKYAEKEIKTIIQKAKEDTISSVIEEIEGMKVEQKVSNGEDITIGYNQALEDLKTLLTKE